MALGSMGMERQRLWDAKGTKQARDKDTIRAEQPLVGVRSGIIKGRLRAGLFVLFSSARPWKLSFRAVKLALNAPR